MIAGEYLVWAPRAWVGEDDVRFGGEKKKPHRGEQRGVLQGFLCFDALSIVVKVL